MVDGRLTLAYAARSRRRGSAARDWHPLVAFFVGEIAVTIVMFIAVAATIEVFREWLLGNISG
jgi:hypothetical protein